MKFNINGQQPGIYCAQRRTFVNTGQLILGRASDQFYITQATYNSPFGEVFGLRHKTLLYNRCFKWIGNQIKYIEKKACLMVRRISDDMLWFCELITGKLFIPKLTKRDSMCHKIRQTSLSSAARASGLLF